MKDFVHRISPKRWVLIALVLVVVVLVWFRFLHVSHSRYSVGKFDDAAFKYGTIGVETTLEGAFPLDVWLVLPTVFPDFLPTERPRDGYRAFGFLYEDGHELPIGFSRSHRGLDLVGINCAVCHTGSYRLAPGGMRTIVPGGAAVTQDTQAYLRFLFRCGSDPRFNADTLVAAIKKHREQKNTKLGKVEEAVLRPLIPVIRKAIGRQAKLYAWSNRNPRWGPGRIDPFNPIKFGILQRPSDDSIGNADMMPIWRMSEHTADGMRFHWDGLNGTIREVTLSSALGDGATPRTLDLGRMAQLEEYLMDLPVPTFPASIDKGLAAKGKQVFGVHCADCHGVGGEKTGTVIPVTLSLAAEDDSHIATDPERVFMWDKASADQYNLYSTGYSWQFYDFQNLDGYLSVLLDGVWMRGPYLHNGSVPTLWHLLNPDQRPARFYRGCDIIDLERVGFVWDQAREGHRKYFEYDTSMRGNGNAGHLYGSELSDEDKSALIEYMKTL